MSKWVFFVLFCCVLFYFDRVNIFYSDCTYHSISLLSLENEYWVCCTFMIACSLITLWIWRSQWCCWRLDVLWPLGHFVYKTWICNISDFSSCHLFLLLDFIEFAHLYFNNFTYCLNCIVCVNILWYVLYGYWIRCLLCQPFSYSHLY